MQELAKYKHLSFEPLINCDTQKPLCLFTQSNVPSISQHWIKNQEEAIQRAQ